MPANGCGEVLTWGCSWFIQYRSRKFGLRVIHLTSSSGTRRIGIAGLFAFISIAVSEFPEIAGRLLVIFDGHCGLCNRSVRWFLLRDNNDRLRFVPSQSPRVAPLLARHGFDQQTPADGPGSILVVLNPGCPTSTSLPAPPPSSNSCASFPSPRRANDDACLRLVPSPLRDLVYRLIARSRYRIWGRLEVCPNSTAEERSRFLESTDTPPESC